MARHRADPAAHLAQLESKKEKLKKQIVVEKLKMRKDSRKRRAHQSRVLGECVARLADEGRLNDATFKLLMSELIVHAKEKDRAALEGTPFEIAPEAKPSRPPEQSFGLLARAKRRGDPSSDR